MSRPFVLALTGSIGMGKTTTAGLFEEEGIPVWDADAAVHRIYGPGGAAVDAVARLHPEALRDGAIDREALRRWIAQDPAALGQLESVVHPVVAADRAAFIADTTAETVVVDVPLLFETGAEGIADAVVVVTAPPEVQRERVLSRPGMTAERFERLLARQMPDSEKRARADYVIETRTLEDARRAVQDILRDIGQRKRDARDRAGHGDDGARPRQR